MEWASAVLVLENASPAKVAARAIRARRSRLPRSSTNPGRLSRISVAALTAWLVETGLPFTFQMLSREWDRASRAVLIVNARGIPTISSGSISASVAYKDRRDREYLRPVSVSHTDAQLVTSLPVPAVVGMAIIGIDVSASSPAPSSRYRLTAPKPFPPAATTLAASITDPPPRATTTSGTGWAAANRAQASASMWKSGFGTTLSIVSAAGPAVTAMRWAMS